MLKKISIFISVIVMMTVLLAIQAAAAETAAPAAGDITITNNLTGTPDTVAIGNVLVNDIIRVYSTASGGAPIGVTVSDGLSTTFSINQLGMGAGNVYVTVTTTGFSESGRTAVAYIAEPKTAAPASGDISIINNVVGRPDLIMVSNLSAGDIVRVYPNSVSTVTLAAAVNPSGGWLFVNQLGVAAGSVYVTVQSTDELESARTAVGYASETSALLAAGAVTVVNNFYTESGGIQVPGSEDIITVSGVAIGDIITVYKALIGTDIWGTVPVTALNINDDDVAITIGQLGTKAGKVYVTITKVGKAESKRAAVSYIAEPVSDAPLAANITVTNNYSIEDTVVVTGLAANDIVKVYTSPVGLATIGSDSAAADTATVTINAGVLSAAGGKIYVTVTSETANESIRVVVNYAKEDVTTAPSISSVTVVNNYSISDTVQVTGLAIGDIVNIYSTPTGATLIGTDTATIDQVTITLNPGTLLAKGGNIYVTITKTTANESSRRAVPYTKEDVTTAPLVANISVTNNYSASDTVVVSNLTANDVVKVYGSSTANAAVIGSAAEVGGTATVSINAGELSAIGGKIYVTVTSLIANESTRTAFTYLKEATTSAPLLVDIAVTNNYIVPDTIDIGGLTATDIVKVYASPIAIAPIGDVIAVGNTAMVSLTPGVLSASGGKIYVTVKMATANESPRTAVTYASERTTAPLTSTVIVINKYYAEDAGGTQVPGTEDSVTVSGVEIGDIITIYKGSGGTTTWLSPVTVNAGNINAGAVTMTIPQLGTKAGKIYVTVTELNKSESTRAGVAFTTEPTTIAPLAANIIIENNFAAEDTVTVNNLTADQIVTIYNGVTGTGIIADATATGSTYIFVLDDAVLAANGGKLYVSVKDPLKLESVRTAQTYTSETTASPKTSNILIVNYPGSAYDTVTLVGLTDGDIVTIYNAATGGIVLSRETVAGKGTTLTLATNLPDSGGTVYVTVTSEGKAESKRVAVAYQDA